MSGSKLAATVEAAKQFVDLLRPGDQIAVVSFGSSARVDLPLQQIVDQNDQARAAARQAIEAIRASGSTAIGAGLSRAQDEFDARALAGLARAFVLLSDGQENVSPPVAAVLPRLIAGGTALHTIGYGRDADQAELLRWAGQAGGTYNFAPAPDQLPGASQGADANRFFPILGNHDWDVPGAIPYFDYFTLPGDERYYRVVREPVAIYALNSMPGEPDGIDRDSAQAAWLREELAASTSCWNLVFFHHTAYTSGHRGPSEWMRWPYQEWGADATLSGHNHIYERVMVDGFPYFTNGLGGAPRYAYADTFAEGSAVRYNADHGAMLVEGVEGLITFQFFTRTGELIDTHMMEKLCRR